MEFVRAIDPALVTVMNIGLVFFFTAILAVIITSVFCPLPEKWSNVLATIMAVSFVSMMVLKFAGEAPHDSVKIELAKDLYGIELTKYHIESLDYPSEKPTELEKEFGKTTIDYQDESGVPIKKDISLVWVNNEFELYENNQELKRR